MKCYICGKTIRGNGLHFDGLDIDICSKCSSKIKYCKICERPLKEPDHDICEECIKRLKYCKVCNKPITGLYYELKGNYYCESCGIRCDNCGKKIKRFFNNGEKIYCNDCYTKLFGTKCYKCGKNLNRYFKVNNKPYCVDCYKEHYGKVCAGCGKKLTSYFTIGDKVYCKKCADKQKCISCGLPIGENSIEISENMHSCKSCYSDAILTYESLKKLYEETVNVIKKLFNITIPNIDELILSDIKGIRAKRKWASRNTKGFFLRIGNKNSIYVMKGLSKPTAISVLAHEIAHFWQYENNIVSDKKDFIEGFAEWISFKVLEHYNLSKQIESAEKNKYRDYSRGLLLFKKLEKEIGMVGIFSYVKKHKQI